MSFEDIYKRLSFGIFGVSITWPRQLGIYQTIWPYLAFIYQTIWTKASVWFMVYVRSRRGGEHFWWGRAHQVQIIVVPWQTEPALMSWGAEAVAGFRYQLWLGPFLRFEWLVFIYRDCPPVNASLSGVKISTLIPVSSISSIARSYIKEKTICLTFFDPNGPLPEGGGTFSYFLIDWFPPSYKESWNRIGKDCFAVFTSHK